MVSVTYFYIFDQTEFFSMIQSDKKNNVKKLIIAQTRTLTIFNCKVFYRYIMLNIF